MTATPIPPGFLYAIVAAPGDDTPRLAFADWLDEQGEPARAEFIRLQIENAKVELGDEGWPLYGHGPDDNSGNCGVCIPFSRETELWNANDWHSMTAIDRCRGGLIVKCKNLEAVVSRGFLAEVRCDLATLLGGEECVRCRGIGERWEEGTTKHMGQRYPHRKRVSCPACDGTGRTPGIAAELFKAHPVTRVTCGLSPWSDGTGGDSDWSWWRAAAWSGRGEEGNEEGNLPDEVFEKMWAMFPGNVLIGGGPPSNQHIAFDSPGTARKALSATLVAVCRDRAGLPPLTTDHHMPAG